MSVWLQVCFCSLLPLVSHPAGADIGCGAPGWTIPSPPSGAKLIQVHAIIRHGDRTPWTGDPCWPNDTAIWSCSLNSAQIPMYSDSQYGPVVPRLYRKVFDFNGEELNGNCSVGQLTTIGYEQHLLNGASLRKTYVESGFLSDTISPSEVYLRSDNEPRTVQSAEALMLGMFPPNASKLSTEVVELHTVDTLYDYIIPNTKLCPKLEQYLTEFWNSSVWTNHQNVTDAILNALSKAINYPVGESDLDHICDCLQTYKCHDLPWPPGMTESLSEMAWNELSWQFFNQYAYPSVQANAQVGIGFLLKQIWKNMNDSVAGKEIQKFLLYSGHDTTLIPVLIALQVDTMEWPQYASLMLMELYDMEGEVYVRIIYNGDVLALSFCNSETLCDYKTFSKYLASVTPSNPAIQCQF